MGERKWTRTFTAAVVVLLLNVSLRAPSSPSSDSFNQVSKTQAAISVTPENAVRNLVRKFAPIYPPLAKQLRLQGNVEIQVMLSKTGSVDSVKVLSGSPLLVGAAVDAVKQEHYKPFFANAH